MGLWDIDKIPYVGREKGPQEGLAFHYYDADKVVAGKKMKDWLRFGVAWWHTFDQELVDPFGTGTAQRPPCARDGRISPATAALSITPAAKDMMTSPLSFAAAPRQK